MKSISIRPPYSLIFIMDYVSGIVPDVPDEIENRLITATPSCIVVGCRSAQDGPTDINLIQSNELIPPDHLVYEGNISSPRKKLSICSALNEEIISVELTNTVSHIKIFANHPMEPNR